MAEIDDLRCEARSGIASSRASQANDVQSTPRLESSALGFWSGGAAAVHFDPLTPARVHSTLREPVSVIVDPARQDVGMGVGGCIDARPPNDAAACHPALAALAPLYPEWLGDRAFRELHGLRFAYMGGSMARGCASTDLVIALAQSGGLGMFGAAGLSAQAVEAALERLESRLGGTGLPWGINLIHSPDEPGREEALVDLYLRRGVRRVEASAFMRLTPAIVRFACSGLYRDATGEVGRRHHLFAKVSREEVARQFMAPAPDNLLATLVNRGQLSAEEARLAREVPLAGQVIVEADSGGHTDNRPLAALFPVIARLRDDLVAEHRFTRTIHLGAAGGLGTPAALASAYALGAAFVVVGSVHQATVESGVSDDSRELLAQAGPADVAMTASSDMFEMGVRVQVLARGTMMGVRGNQLYELYRHYTALEELPAKTRQWLEQQVFRAPVEEIWQQVRQFFAATDPDQLERAEREPRHRMALLFRWYLGKSSRWPMEGRQERQVDYQLWCGPAMGAFNRWAAGTFLEQVGERRLQPVMLNLLEGAAFVTRAHQYRTHGLHVPAQAFHYQPMRLRIA